MAIKRFSEAGAPVPSPLISWAEFIEQAAVHPSLVGELIELGWLVPILAGGDNYLFRVRDVYRLRKHRRLCEDFDLTAVGGTIVVDLLERIELLEARVRELEALARTIP
ncbi:MAG: chaperone modulator CbpM [Desulfovibrionaceae bacterium]